MRTLMLIALIVPVVARSGMAASVTLVYGVPMPGTFAAAGVGNLNGNGFSAYAGNLNIIFSGTYDSEIQTSSGTGLTIAGASYPNPIIVHGNTYFDLSALANAQPGIVRLGGYVIDTLSGFGCAGNCTVSPANEAALAEGGFTVSIPNVQYQGLPNGALLDLTFPVIFDGDVLAGGTAAAAAFGIGVQVAPFGGEGLAYGISEQTNPNNFYGFNWNFVQASQTIHFPVIVGQPAEMAFAAAMLLNTFTNDSILSGHFGNTIYWGGLSSVSMNGVPLDPSLLTFKDSSGIDWTQSFAPAAAVPEPGTWGMLLLGMVMVAGARRRRAGVHRVKGGLAR